MFYLTTHSTHFIYGYMASEINKWAKEINGWAKLNRTVFNFLEDKIADFKS